MKYPSIGIGTEGQRTKLEGQGEGKRNRESNNGSNRVRETEIWTYRQKHG